MADPAAPQLPSLREVLRRPALRDAEVLAGRRGLDRPVRWVHVGEIPDVARYLRGQELILSTGVGLRRPQDRHGYLERLAACGVAGVCIELGRYLRRIPDDMVRLADHLGLPLIAFRHPVRFADITRDVHAVILQGEAQLLQTLHLLAEDLRAPHGTPLPAADVLGRLGAWLGDAVVLQSADGPTLTAGPAARARDLADHAQGLLAAGDSASDARLPDGSLVLARAVALPQGAALLAAVCAGEERIAADLALDLAVAALGRLPATGDRSQGWAQDDPFLLGRLTAGRLPAPELREALERWRSAGRLPGRAVLCLFAAPDPTARADSLRADLARRGLPGLVGRLGPHLGVLLFDPPPERELPALLAQLRHAADGPPVGASATLGVGDLAPARRQAEIALAVAVVSGGEASPLFGDLGALRALAALPEGLDRAGLAEDDLGPVLAHDRRHGTELLRTLDVLLRVERKDEAARRLGIRRQTLYARIDRLGGLLGEDFLRPERRLSLLLARLLLVDAGHGVQGLDGDI